MANPGDSMTGTEKDPVSAIGGIEKYVSAHEQQVIKMALPEN
jgi:hypothetical protein